MPKEPPMKAKPVPNEHYDTDMVPLLQAAITHARAERRRLEVDDHQAAKREAVLVAREKRHLALIRGGA